MDPLSLTVAAIAFLQATTTIVQICNDYRISLESALKDVIRLTKEVISLRHVLQGLLDLSERAESGTTSDEEDYRDVCATSQFPILKLLLQPGGPVEECSTELEALRVKLSAPETGSKPTFFKKAVRKLKWPMTEQDITNPLVDAERLKTTFSLVLTTEQTIIALAIQISLRSLTESLFFNVLKRWLT